MLCVASSSTESEARKRARDGGKSADRAKTGEGREGAGANRPWGLFLARRLSCNRPAREMRLTIKLLDAKRNLIKSNPVR